MPREIVKIEGLADLDAALAGLREEFNVSKATARNVLLRTLKEQGQPIADMGEAIAPRRTGGLAESYTVSTKLSRRQKRMNTKESPVEVYVGPGSSAKAIQTEFGNAHQAPEPHLRPAWDANVPRVLKGITVSLANQIEKARVRLAKKAERLAAQMRA